MKNYKNEVNGMKKLAISLSFFISTLGLVSSCTNEIKNYQIKDRVVKEVAGEDRVIDYNETRKALNVLGYKEVILNDRERIYFEANGWDDYIEISVGTQAPLPAFQDNRSIGRIKGEELEKIILNAFRKLK